MLRRCGVSPTILNKASDYDSDSVWGTAFGTSAVGMTAVATTAVEMNFELGTV